MAGACLLVLCLMFSGVAPAAATHTFTVAHDATWPPMEYVDEHLHIVGYSVDYIDAVAKEAGFAVRHRNVAWDGIFSGLAGGRHGFWDCIFAEPADNEYDIVASSVTITEERGKVMDFSLPYYEASQVLVTPKTTHVEKLEDMAGKRVGAKIGSTGFMTIDKSPHINAVITYNEIGRGMADLAAGLLDAIICDAPVADRLVLENRDYAEKMKVALVVPTDAPEYYGFAVNKGNRDVLELLNKGIAAVKAKGIEAELREKWFGR